jgi:predicted nucleotidyltransferase
MEVQIKRAVKAGNSSAVILPRSWLNKDVRIELIKKTPKIILFEVINLLNKYIDLENVIGIYLVGSYARGDEDENSDIDILVLTKGIDKEIIKEGVYSILLISSELLKQKLNQDLFPIGQMIKEAKPLLNSDYLSKVKIKVNKKNIGWYLKTTQEKLNVIKKVLEKTGTKTKAKAETKNSKSIDNRVVYTLVLRIRTLYIIKKLIKNEKYSKKDFIKLIEKVSKGKNTYQRYLDVKNDLESEQKSDLEESRRLYLFLENQLEEIKRLI